MSFKLAKDQVIFVAGHTGMLGSAFLRFFESKNYSKVVTASRDELDLMSKSDVDEFFKKHRPEVVVLAAGKVGGIVENRDFPADFIFENTFIQSNIFSIAQKYKVRKLLFFGSSCMYPKDTTQPMREQQLCTGHLEETSVAYATAKFLGVQMCQALNRQNKETAFIPVIPNSVFGPNDNFDLATSHVLSAVIRRVHEALEDKKPCITLWGTGLPRREFIYVDDVVSACITLLNSNISCEELPINIGTGVDISIKELAGTVSRIVGYEGEIKWDTSKPDGVLRKLLDNSRIKSLGWGPKNNFENNLKETYKWFLSNRCKETLKNNYD